MHQSKKMLDLEDIDMAELGFKMKLQADIATTTNSHQRGEK